MTEPHLSADAAATYPMTRTQRIVRACWEDASGAPTAVHHAAFRIRGHLNADALSRSVELLDLRHPVLRSVFPGAAHSTATIGPAGAGRLRVLEQLARPDAERLLTQWLRTPVDVVEGPLFGGLLVPIARAAQEDTSHQEHLFAFRAHHLVCDTRSLGVLLCELGELYDTAARPGHPPAAPHPRADPAVMGSSGDQPTPSEETIAADVAWWCERLASCLPLDLPRDEVADGTGGLDRTGRTERYTVAHPLGSAVRSAADVAAATPLAVLLAAFRLLLARLSGNGDVCVGALVDGRNGGGGGGPVGALTETFALRSTVADDESFTALVARESRNLAEAYLHRHGALDQVVEVLSRQRVPGRSPRFEPYLDVVVEYVADVAPALLLSGADAEALEPVGVEVNRRLTLDIHDRADGGFEVVATYRTAVFSAARVQALLRQLCHLLEQVTAAPGQPVSAHSLITAVDRSLLGDPARTLDAPTHPSVPELVADRRRADPGAEAIVCAGRSWTYEQLGTRTQRVAAELRAAGVRPGAVVAISGVMSAEMVAAMLAILSVGAVVMPVDPELHRTRIKMMLDDGAVEHVVVAGGDGTDAARLAWQAGLPVTVLPRRLPDDGARDLDTSCTTPGALDPAYVMFTSGTTGRPKRVVGPHGALAHFLCAQQREFRIAPGDRCAQLTGLSFDVLFRDVFLALTSGATLCIPEDDDRRPPQRLLRWLARERITVVHTVPSIARTWLNEADASLVPGLRWAFFAGEALDDDLVRRWRAVFPGRIVNIYGPSETVLAKLWHNVEEVPRVGAQPLGTPLPYVQVFVVASDGRRLCGIGEAGEIAIRTPFRSLTGASADSLTGTRFVPNRWSTDAPAEDLVCLTGDRGRWLADATVEYLGRVDDQVKVRGVRVATEEVNGALRRLAGVRDAVVLPMTTGGVVSLVAHVVVAPSGSWSAAAVRGALRETLPSAMVPRTVRFLDALPLTRNGKIDRAALLDAPPDGRDDDQRTIADPPGDDLQRTIAGIWCDVLGVRAVGIRDNFFDLGGDSLLLVEVHRQIRHRLRADMPMTNLFRNPTVESLARGFGGATDRPDQGQLDAASSRGARRRTRRAGTAVAPRRRP